MVRCSLTASRGIDIKSSSLSCARSKPTSRKARTQPHDIAQLLNEERVGGELEALAAVRLDAKELQVAMNAGLGDASI